MSNFRIKTKSSLLKRPKFTRVTREKIEYYYANMFFLYTICFLLVCGFFNFGGKVDDYLIRIIISQTEYTIPLIAYLYVARQNIDLVNGERNALVSVTNRIGLHKISPLKIIVSIVIGVAIIPFLSLINVVSSFMVNDVTSDRAMEAAAKHPMWLMLLFVCIVPPIVEEVTYRGVYFTAYRRSGVIKGALISAGIFGLMHGNLNQFAYAIVAGFIFAMLVYASGSIISTIIVHIVINASSVITMYSDKTGFRIPRFIVTDKKFDSVLSALSGMWLQALIGLVIVAVGYYVLRLLSEKEKKAGNGQISEKIDTETRVVDTPLILATAIMLANMIANEFIK